MHIFGVSAGASSALRVMKVVCYSAGVGYRNVYVYMMYIGMFVLCVLCFYQGGQCSLFYNG